MKMRLLVGLLCALAVWSSAFAKGVDPGVMFRSQVAYMKARPERVAFFHAGITGTPTPCPLGGNDGGGYAGAPVANAYTVKHANFFTGYANQSGQTYDPTLLAARTVCQAGIDYPVGPNKFYTTHTSRGTVDVSMWGVSGGLTDPAKASNISAINTAAGGGTVCRLINGRAYLLCDGATTADKTLYIEGFDFSAAGNSISTAVTGVASPTGMGLFINTAVTGPCVIANNNFVIDPNTYSNSASARLQVAGCSTVTFINNRLMPASRSVWSTTSISFFAINANGTLTSRYNAILNCPARCLATSGASLDTAFDYFEGIKMNATHNSDHGDGIYISDYDTPLGNGPLPLYSMRYDTWVQPATADLPSTGLATVITNLQASTNCTGTETTVTNTITNISGCNPTGQEGYYVGWSSVAATRPYIISTVAGTGPYTLTMNNLGLNNITGTFAIYKPSTVNQLILEGNVFVSNLTSASTPDPGGANQQTTSYLAWMAYASYPSVLIRNNLLDPTGTTFCFGDVGLYMDPGAVLTGNKVLLSGNSWNKFDTSPRVATGTQPVSACQ